MSQTSPGLIGTVSNNSGSQCSDVNRHSNFLKSRYVKPYWRGIAAGGVPKYQVTPWGVCGEPAGHARGAGWFLTGCFHHCAPLGGGHV